MYKQDVKLLHYVPCYSDEWAIANKPECNEDYGHGHIYNSWSGTCICHHATWHSCPDKEKGKHIWDKLPNAPEKEPQENVLQQILVVLNEISAKLGE